MEKNHKNAVENFSIENMVRFCLNTLGIAFTGAAFGVVISLAYLFITPSQFKVNASFKFDHIYDKHQIESFSLPALSENKLLYDLYPLVNGDSTLLHHCNIKDSEDLQKKSINLEVRSGYLHIVLYTTMKERALDCVNSLIAKARQVRDVEILRLVQVNQKLIGIYNSQLKEMQANINKNISGPQNISLAVNLMPDFYDLNLKIKKMELLVQGLLEVKDSNIVEVKFSDAPVLPDKKKIILIGLLFGALTGFAFSVLKNKFYFAI